VLGAAPEPGVLGTVLHADPDDLERFWCEFPASRHMPARMDVEAFRAGRHFYQLEAERMHPQAERVLPEVIGDALERADVTPDGVALLLVHYLDHRVARRAARAAGVPDERIVATAEAAGHMAAAGIPSAPASKNGGSSARTGDPRSSPCPRRRRRSGRRTSRRRTSISSSSARSPPTSIPPRARRSCNARSVCAACQSSTSGTSARGFST